MMNEKKSFRRGFCAFALAVLLLLGCSVTAGAPSVPALSSYGSSGDEVTAIQTVLKNKGYYRGSVDGVYGSATAAAVKKFQADQGLTADGICGTKTLNALGLSVSGTLRNGSAGNAVIRVQTKLRSLGYYDGQIDGLYGSKTEAAVRRFQYAKGLTADGICGVRTLSALGLSSVSAAAQTGTVNDGNVYLLARIISAEARGESYTGQVAVGAVVMNRVKSTKFPNTLAGVIYQPGAFTAVTDGQFDQPIADSAYRAARDALNGVDPTGGCLYYYNPATATSSWIFSLPVKTVIGKHRFSMGK